MDREELHRRVVKTTIEHLGVEEEKVTPDAHYIDDLGADSLDLVELVMAFEEDLNVTIQDDETDRINTVNDAVDLLDRKVNAK
jgi:acyl carrier protein